MAHRYGERHQNLLLPMCIDDYIAEDDPVRAYDAFVDALDWDTLDIPLETKKRGCSEYSPVVMLKVLLYGYSYGIRSSRKLERALHHNLSFIWLAGGLKPDDRTICRFRRNHAKALKKVFKQCARLCIQLDLIEGNTLFVDGTKLRASAAVHKDWTSKKCKILLEHIDKRIDEILAECDQTDQQERTKGSLVKLEKELASKNKLKAKIQSALETIETEDLKRLNPTDPDSARMRGRQGTHASYNAQIVVDEQHGLIVSNDVVNDGNDVFQFTNQMNQAMDVLDDSCTNAVADAGYFNSEDLETIDAQGINVIVPTTQQTRGKEPGPFDRSRFHYDADEDCYICPEGKKLPKRSHKRGRRSTEYALDHETCRQCQHYGTCCTSKKLGRTIMRYDNEALRQKLKAQYESKANQAIYARRQSTVELPFGHIKRNLGVTSFLLRGFEGVRAEMAILSSCFNLVRLVGIFGVQGLIAKLLLS
jgi:transposase